MRSVEQISFNETPNTSQWIHTAVTRSKINVVILFVNGVLKQEEIHPQKLKQLELVLILEYMLKVLKLLF